MWVRSERWRSTLTAAWLPPPRPAGCTGSVIDRSAIPPSSAPVLMRTTAPAPCRPPAMGKYSFAPRSRTISAPVCSSAAAACAMPYAKSSWKNSRRCTARAVSSRSIGAAKSPWNSTRKACFAPAENPTKSRGLRSTGHEPRESSDGLGALSAPLFEAAGSQRVIFGLHDDHTISALFLGAIQGLVGQLDQTLVRAGAARQDKGCADADRQPACHSRCLVRNIEFRDGSLNSRQHLSDVFAAGLVQNDRKLLSAVARHEIQRPAGALTEAHGHGS